MHDAEPRAAIRCDSLEEAKTWNTPELGFGIFRTVNSFAGARRKENLTRINAWCVDMDAGTKQEMASKLMASPLVPSIIVETKRGYQAYWMAQDGAKPEHWNAIVLERIVPHYGADKNARDLCRILRAPGFLHLKNPAEPFRCKTVWRHHVAYSERQMAEAWRWVPDPKAVEQAKQEAIRATRSVEVIESSDDFWNAISNLDCRDALARLSGSGYVNGEQYSFRSCASGNWNIVVDGKGTSCFVDANGKIGSLSGGGPMIVHWLKWLGRDWKTAIEAVKSVYPHIAEIDERTKQRRRAA